MRTEYTPVEFKRAKDIGSFYTGRKVTVLGRASVNVSKHSDRKWHVTGFRVKASHPHSRVNSFGELVYETTGHVPIALGWQDTLWEAKAEAEYWINEQVCMKNLHGEVMYDEDYEYDREEEPDTPTKI